MSVVACPEMPSLFDQDFCLRPLDENHVSYLTNALKAGDSVPLPKVAKVGGKLVVLDGNHTLLAMQRAGMQVRYVYLGEMDYLSAIKVVLQSNPVGYKPPTQAELQAFLCRAYVRARELGVSRSEFLKLASEATGRSQRTLYRMLKDVFRSEDERLRHTALDLLTSGKSLRVVADAVGVSISTIKRWASQKHSYSVLPPMRIFTEEKVLTEEFLQEVKNYLEIVPKANVDGLFIWLCRRYAIDYREWADFSRNARRYLPADVLNLLGVGDKKYFLSKEALREMKKEKGKEKEAKEVKERKQRRITLKGVRAELLRISKTLEDLMVKLDDPQRKELSKVLKALAELEERVLLSLTPRSSQEVNEITREALEILDKVHAFKTGYSLINQENAGKYFNLIRRGVLQLLKRYEDRQKVRDAIVVAFVFNAYVRDEEWAEFLKNMIERLDWLKHRFSIGLEVWSKVIKKSLNRQAFMKLVDEVSQELQKSMSMSSSSSPGTSSATASAG